MSIWNYVLLTISNQTTKKQRCYLRGKTSSSIYSRNICLFGAQLGKKVRSKTIRWLCKLHKTTVPQQRLPKLPISKSPFINFFSDQIISTGRRCCWKLQSSRAICLHITEHILSVYYIANHLYNGCFIDIFINT